MRFAARDERWMRLALALGRRNSGRTWPNPSVGCVIVSGDRVAGRGWTQPGGRPHAEMMALESAGNRARGATAYVTLEPCSHHARTPPCAELLVASGVTRVVTAIEDPDPRVSGAGHRMLEKAGVAVETGCLGDLAASAHKGFFMRVKKGRSMVTLKLASSLDGRIATKSGSSKWITGPEARRFAHLMRSRHDAVMVGRGTVLADNPMLTPRGLGETHSPVRVVLDSHLATATETNLAKSARNAPVWVCHARHVDEDAKQGWLDAGATLIECRESRETGLEVVNTLERLAERGITSVFCEGGSRLATSLLEANVADRVVCFTAGLALGNDALPSLQALGLHEVGQAHRLKLEKVARIGGDTVTFWSNPDAS